MPVSQSRSDYLYVCGMTQQASAADFGPFTNGFSNGCGTGTTFGNVYQGSSIDPSLISAYGDADGESTVAKAEFSVTFNVAVPCSYNLSGYLKDDSENEFQHPAMKPLTLTGPMGSICTVQIAAYASTNFALTGTLAPGQYTITAGAEATALGHDDDIYQYALALALTPITVPFQITSITRQTNDVLLTWTAFGGTTNIVQATSGAPDGSYSTNFSTISPLIIIPGTNIEVNVTTNYLDVGGAVNTSRYYRVQQLP